MLARMFAVVTLGLLLCTLSLDAQGTKKAAGSIEIYKNKDREFRYRIKGADGKIIAMPPTQMSWESKAEALKAINDLKAVLNTATPIDGKDTEIKAKS
jgi:uncharacterized protein YegP (UPF0339 family)